MAVRENYSVLVTGGRGFIGRAVCRLLQREGFHVVSLDQSAANDATEPPANNVSCDIADPIALKSVFEKEPIDGIIHLAAILPTAAHHNPVRATEVNIGGSLNVLEMARHYGVRRIVFGSSLSVYGTCPTEELVSEERTVAPEDLYAAAKVYVERLGEAYRSRYGLEFVSLRIGRVIGPGSQSTSSAWRSQIFENLRAGDAVDICLPFVPSERILLVHVQEVARMLVTLLTEKFNHSLYNACCESIVVEELKRLLESLNPDLRIILGNQPAAGNPRQLDYSRFQNEFDFRTEPIFEQLRGAARQANA